jgi:hypothetical protein
MSKKALLHFGFYVTRFLFMDRANLGWAGGLEGVGHEHCMVVQHNITGVPE